MPNRTARRAAALALALISVCAHANKDTDEWLAYHRGIARDMHANVIDAMRDGPAARFRGEFLSENDPADDPHATALCGEVNGKNAYGGYTGFYRFIITTKGMLVFEQTNATAFSYIWPVWCVRPLPVKLPI